MFPKLNISRIEANKNQPAKGSDNLPMLKYNYSQNYTTPLNSFNKYLVNFTGLNRTLSKMPYQSEESIKKEVDNFPQSNAVVGNLPSEWVNKIPKENRAEKIKELYRDFKTIIKDFREKNNIDDTAQKLNNALHKAGVIEEHEKLTLKRLGDGVAGAGYCLKGISNDNLMIKIFDSPSDEGLSSDIHGKYVEINRAAYWQKYAGKNTQMVRFYFGDTDAGYMVNKYIDKEKTPYCTRYVDPKLYGLISADVVEKETVTGHNKINGFQIDYGDIEILDLSLVRNKEAQSSTKKFLRLPIAKRIELIKNTKNNIKKVFACNIDSFPEDERVLCFKQLAENSDNGVKKVLAARLVYLPEAERVEYFKQFNENADDDLKKILILRLAFLPATERATYFKQFADNADNGIKKALAFNINCLPETDRVMYFKQLAENADNGVKKALACSLYCLPETEMVQCFKKLAENADNGVKKELASNINCLPETERVTYFKQFADNADNEVKKALACKLDCLPKNQRGKCFSQLAENADIEVKKALAYKFVCLPKNEMSKCFKQLANNFDDELKRILESRIDFLPVHKQAECRKLLD